MFSHARERLVHPNCKDCDCEEVKELAHRRGISVDEYINNIMKLAAHPEWTVCNLCGAKVKSINLPDYKAKIHPGPT